MCHVGICWFPASNLFASPCCKVMSVSRRPTSASPEGEEDATAAVEAGAAGAASQNGVPLFVGRPVMAELWVRMCCPMTSAGHPGLPGRPRITPASAIAGLRCPTQAPSVSNVFHGYHCFPKQSRSNWWICGLWGPQTLNHRKLRGPSDQCSKWKPQLSLGQLK